MTVRVDIAFAQPIDDEVRVRLLIATGALPEVRRCVVSPDRCRATVYAADIAAGRVEEAVRAGGGDPVSVSASLAPETEASLVAAPGERFRPIGR